MLSKAALFFNNVDKTSLVRYLLNGFVERSSIFTDEKLSLLSYDASHEGMMDSWRERFTPEEHQKVDKILEDLYLKDRDIFKVTA